MLPAFDQDDGVPSLELISVSGPAPFWPKRFKRAGYFIRRGNYRLVRTNSLHSSERSEQQYGDLTFMVARLEIPVSHPPRKSFPQSPR